MVWPALDPPATRATTSYFWERMSTAGERGRGRGRGGEGLESCVKCVEMLELSLCAWHIYLPTHPLSLPSYPASPFPHPPTDCPRQRPLMAWEEGPVASESPPAGFSPGVGALPLPSSSCRPWQGSGAQGWWCRRGTWGREEGKMRDSNGTDTLLCA